MATENTTAPEAVRIARKFTTRGMGMDSDALQEIVADAKGEVDIFNVLALVSGYKVETNTKDPSKTSKRFSGQFEIQNAITGEIGNFPEAYFPGVAEAYAAGLKDAAGEGSAVIPFIITVMRDDSKNSAQGYKFGVKGFVDKSAEGADPFKGIRKFLPKVELKKALPAGKGKK